MGTPDIKVITGVRRCGKPKRMELFMNFIRTNDPYGNAVHVNFYLSSGENLTEYRGRKIMPKRRFVPFPPQTRGGIRRDQKKGRLRLRLLKTRKRVIMGKVPPSRTGRCLPFPPCEGTGKETRQSDSEKPKRTKTEQRTKP